MVPEPETPEEVFTGVCPLVTWGLGATLELDETDTTGSTDAVGNTANGISVDGGGTVASPRNALAPVEGGSPFPAPHRDATTLTSPALTTATKTATPTKARGTRNEAVGGEATFARAALASAFGIVTA